MALTGNTICGVCGKNVGKLSALYTASEMNDNCYMCNSCHSKCSKFLNSRLIHGWKKYDAENHMAFLAECKERIATDFHATDCVMNGEKRIIAFDADKKWWIVGGRPDIFRFDQIESWDISISATTENEGIHFRDFNPPRHYMETPDKFEEMTALYLDIKLADHPYADEVRVKVVGSNTGLLTTYHKYLTESYALAEQCFQLLEKYSDPKVTGDVQFFM